MSLQFRRRGSVGFKPSTARPFEPVGTQHLWWANDLLSTANYNDEVSSFDDAINALSLLAGGDSDLLANRGFNGKPGIVPADDMNSLMTGSISSLPYTTGSIFVFSGFGGNWYSALKIRLYNGSFGAGDFIEFTITPDTSVWSVGVDAYLSSSYSFTSSVARTSLYSLIEINSLSGELSFKLNGLNIDLTPNGEFTTAIFDNIWISDFEYFEIQALSTTDRWAGYPLALITDENPTDREDLASWIEAYYGIRLG